MATVNKDFVVRNGIVAGEEVQGTQLISTTSSNPPLVVTSSANVTNLSADYVDGLDSSYLLDWSNTTNKPDLTITVELSGGLVGTGSATFTDLQNGTIVIQDAGVALDAVTLGVETFGDYVESIQPGNSIVISHTSGESASPTISTIQDISSGASPTFGALYITDIFTVGSSALVNNLNSQYLNGYTVEQLIGMSGVQSVIGTDNEVTVSASTGNIQVGLPDNVTIAGSLTVGENLIVTGSSVIINSTVVTIDDPIFTLGGDTDGIDDGKDRGIEFKWNDGTAKLGFFGFDDSTGKFTFIPDATNSAEVFSGTKGEIDANVDWSNILNIPDPTITLIGDVSGGATLTDLGSASITVTVEKDFNLVFTGDVTGTGTVSNLDSASITLTIAADSIALGTDTTGDYVAGIYGTADQVLVAGSGGETASVVLSLPQSIGTTSTPTFAGVDFAHATITTSTVTVTANDTPTTIDSFSVSSFTTAEYLLQAKQGTKMTSSKVLVSWDGTNAYITEYAIVDSANGAANIILTASAFSGGLFFKAESPDAATTNVDIKAVRTLIDS
jgi:hypothetical protein